MLGRWRCYTGVFIEETMDAETQESMDGEVNILRGGKAGAGPMGGRCQEVPDEGKTGWLYEWWRPGWGKVLHE